MGTKSKGLNATRHYWKHQRPINTVFQHYALFPYMTVHEIIAFGLKRLGKPESEINKTV